MTRGSGSITQAKDSSGSLIDNKWRIQVYDPVSQKVVGRRFTGTRQAAEMFMQRTLAPKVYREGRVAEAEAKSAGLTFGQLGAEWLADRKAKGHSPKAIKEDRAKLAGRLSRFANVLVSDISALELSEAYAEWVTEVSSRTVRHHHSVVRAILNWGRKRYPGQFPANPALDAYVPALSTVEQKVPTVDEIRTMLKVAHERDAMAIKGIRSRELLVTLSLGTGCRRGELAGLKWSDLDFASKTVNITRSYGETDDGWAMKGTKTGQMRSLPLWDDVVDLLKEQHRQQEICTGTAIRPVFILGDDSGLAPINPDYLTERFQTIAEKLGLDGVHLHSMRHAFASFLIESGVDVVTVSKLVGHSTITTTLNIYAHTNETAKRAAIVGLPKLALPA